MTMPCAGVATGVVRVRDNDVIPGLDGLPRLGMTGSDMLSWFEVPRPLIEPTLRALRLWNTALDALFYDVTAVVTDLL